MIGVIADDLTGAAELGAVGLRWGLDAEIVTGSGTPSGAAELVCLDTHSRSLAPGRAAERARSAVRKLRQWQAQFTYKKVDSVLRGNVVAEIKAIAGELQTRCVLLVPANPGLGRTIVNGEYFVKGTPIHETEFAHDPEHPRLHARVIDLLGASGDPQVRLCSVSNPLPPEGLIVAQVAQPADLPAWATKWAPEVLAAGGAEFFAAWLGRLVQTAPDSVPGRAPPPFNERELFVCGSKSEATRNFIFAARAAGTPVFRLPESISLDNLELMLCDANSAITDAFKAGTRVVLEIGSQIGSRPRPVAAGTLAAALARLAREVLSKIPVGRVYVEGGATALELTRCMGWNRLRVIEEAAPGVATLMPDGGAGLQLTIKPGSYVWPKTVQAHPNEFNL